jgi:hypothetical protein
MNRHWKDEEIQDFLDGARPDESRREHLDRCGACAARVERFRTLFADLGDLERIEPSPGFEAGVLARLFPTPEPALAAARSRLPEWARALAPLMLLTGSAAFYVFLRIAGVLGDTLMRWGLQSEPGLLRLLARKLTLLGPVLARAIDGLVEFAAAMEALGRAAGVVAEAEGTKILFVSSVALVLLVALGWGTRVLLSRIKEGHHGLLLS